MSTVTAGVPGWVDLASPDLDATKRFYGELFGWEASASDPQFGGYTVFTRNGGMVGGAGPTMGDARPPAWATYVIVDDADATAERVRAAGGTVAAGPMGVGDQGRMAVFVDSSGAEIRIWQPGANRGAEVFNEPGALTWNELSTTDPAAAKRFYPAVFGWEAADTQAGDFTYTEWKLDGRSIAGMAPAAGGSPSAWGVRFAVADCDEAVAMIGKLGGSIVLPPSDIDQGRLAVAADPQGAVFSIIALAG